MKILPHILFLSASTLLFVASSHAQTLTIIDKSGTSDGSVSEHAPIGHFQEFGTDLSAKVMDAPVDSEETYILGPVFKWGGGGGDGQIILAPLDGKDSSLKNRSPLYDPHYAGTHSILVQCTATYSRYLKKNDKFVQSVPVKGSLTVKFFSRAPVRVENLVPIPIGKLLG